MPDLIPPSAFAPSLFTEAPVAAMNAGLTLLSRRSTALAEFWRSCAAIREPTDLMALQLNYWTQFVDDVQEAFAKSMSQVASTASAAAAAPSGSTARTA